MKCPQCVAKRPEEDGDYCEFDQEQQWWTHHQTGANFLKMCEDQGIDLNPPR